MDSSKTLENIKYSFQQKSLYKIGLFGDSNVGKTSLIRKYLTGKVSSDLIISLEGLSYMI